ncbi:MAG: DUF4358 domain-containing protein [Muribaculum sp.]|nr:DUF4358 domain-containing protein [Muribaculum sp.]
MNRNHRKRNPIHRTKRALVLCIAALAFGCCACGSRREDLSTQPDTSQQSGAQGDFTVQESGETGEFSDDVEGGWSEEMTALKQAVAAELGDDYWPEMQMPAEYLEMTYGLSPELYEDYMGEMPLMSTHVDTLLIVKAAEGQADAVEEALKVYRTDLVENGRQYPMNVGRVLASRVERIGDYVCFLLLGGEAADVDEDDQEALIVHCQEQNQRAVDAIKEQIDGGR